MENPTFRLEGIVKNRDELADFEGPLSLILLLLSKNKIEIREVKISVILEQYIAYLDEMKRMDLEIASEFTAMASHLTYIKAKVLLAADGEEVTELEALLSSLEELKRRDGYSRIKFAAEFLAACAPRGEGVYIRPPEAIKAPREYEYRHDRSELEKAVLAVLGRDEAEAVPHQVAVPSRVVYSVSRKSGEIMRLLDERGSVRAGELFGAAKGKSELVATFVSVLELCKTGSIILLGADGELTVARAAGSGRI